MGTEFSVRYNVMDIHSIEGFVGIKGGFHQGCKDVYFLRALGTHTQMVKEVQNMDQVLGLQAQKGKGFYRRLKELPKMVVQEEIAYYAQCFDEWVRGGRQEIKIRLSACKETNFRRILSQACLSAGKLYQEGRTQVSASMVKNFMIKLLFWFDFLYESESFLWREERNAKVVAENVTKEQEYLFWYAVTLTGSDVLLLQYKEDVTTDKLGLSGHFTLGSYGEVVLPPYVGGELKPEETQQGKTKQQNPTAAVSESNLSAIGQRGGQEQRKTTSTQGATEKNIRIVIPRREGRETPTNPSIGREVVGRAVHTISGGTGIDITSRREKTYEELAQMASSVVMIALHDEEGKVRGTGSGIMIGRDGYILTNDHVARGGRFYSVKIEDDDNIYHTDEMIKYNSVLDLAILRIQRQLNPLSIYRGQTKLVRGQRVVAIGSPLGLFNSVSDGIISGFRTINSVDMIQFTAPISSGSSGGAVLNMYGEVIGISTSGYDEGQNINLAMGYECITHFIKGFT